MERSDQAALLERAKRPLKDTRINVVETVSLNIDYDCSTRCSAIFCLLETGAVDPMEDNFMILELVRYEIPVPFFLGT